VHRKVPSIAVLAGNQLEITGTNFKGDTSNDSYTNGIFLRHSDAIIKRCSFAHHKAGAIMIDMKPQNRVFILENNIVSSETGGIYVQGKSAKPFIKGNKLKYCHASAIKTSQDVDAFVSSNVW